MCIRDSSMSTHLNVKESRLSFTEQMRLYTRELRTSPSEAPSREKCMDALVIYHENKVRQHAEIVKLLSSGKQVTYDKFVTLLRLERCKLDDKIFHECGVEPADIWA